MNALLEPIDKLVAGIDDGEREASFAVASIDWHDAATLRWAAAALAVRANELDPA